jgi:hypothetical protein
MRRRSQSTTSKSKQKLPSAWVKSRTPRFWCRAAHPFFWCGAARTLQTKTIHSLAATSGALICATAGDSTRRGPATASGRESEAAPTSPALGRQPAYPPGWSVVPGTVLGRVGFSIAPPKGPRACNGRTESSEW